MIKEILPHIAALNQLYAAKDQSANAGAVTISPAVAAQSLRNALAVDNREFRSRKKSESEAQMLGERNGCETITTSNHYCVVESEHPYRSATISCQHVEFPPCVQWLTIEFDPQSGTAQLEDYLLLSIPMRPTVTESCPTNEDYFDMLDNNVRRGQGCTGNALISSCYKSANAKDERESGASVERDWIVVKKFNTWVSIWIRQIS